MKTKLLIFALIFLTSCGAAVYRDYTIIESIQLNPRVRNSLDPKYIINLKNDMNSNDFYFLSDNKYQVGDTIYFCTAKNVNK